MLDLGDRDLGLGLVPVHDLPARRLGKRLADVDDDQRQHRPGQVGDAPAESYRQVVQHQDGEQGAEEGTCPVGPVHRQVDVAAVLGRDHLVDRRVDRGVLAADSGAGQHPGRVQEDEPVPALRRRGGEPAADQVDAEGDHEQLPPAELVRQPPEKQRADHLADQVPGRDVRHRARRHAERAGLGQVRADVAGDRDLEAVQYPGDAKRDNQVSVEPRPRKPVDPGWDQRPDDSRLIGRGANTGGHRSLPPSSAHGSPGITRWLRSVTEINLAVAERATPISCRRSTGRSCPARFRRCSPRCTRGCRACPGRKW
jgi:hypothetical protein